MRFSNGLHDGQGGGDTETGAYTLVGGTATPSNGLTVTRNGNASTFLPTEDEWCKAAYDDGLSATYFNYPAGYRGDRGGGWDLVPSASPRRGGTATSRTSSSSGAVLETTDFVKTL
jgi:hypothetical protein